MASLEFEVSRLAADYTQEARQYAQHGCFEDALNSQQTASKLWNAAAHLIQFGLDRLVADIPGERKEMIRNQQDEKALACMHAFLQEGCLRAARGMANLAETLGLTEAKEYYDTWMAPVLQEESMIAAVASAA